MNRDYFTRLGITLMATAVVFGTGWLSNTWNIHTTFFVVGALAFFLSRERTP